MTTSLLRKSAVALTLALAAGGTTSAQPPAAAVQPAGPTAFRAKQVLGTKVALQNNLSIGTVEDIVFSDAGDVEYLIVDNAGKLVTLPWSAATFNFQQKTAVVNITPEQYKVIPTYTVTTYPQFFTPAYRTEVYKYYGITPGELRRLDRKLDRRVP